MMHKCVVRIVKLYLTCSACVMMVLMYHVALHHNSDSQRLTFGGRNGPDVEQMKRSLKHTRKEYNAATEMENRRNHLFNTCAKIGYNTSDERLPRALVSISRAVVYCPVEKTASTFFRRFMYQLDQSTIMRSPFEVPVKLIYGCPGVFTTLQNYASQMATRRQNVVNSLAKSKKKDKWLQKLKGAETIHNFLHRSTNFVFVRDPYTRLFSAYVDKLFAPNPIYWDSWGRRAIKKYRKNPSELSLKCGHDATFQEFLLLVLDLNLKSDGSDPHLRPIFDLCRPCTFNYTVIGHMNTFDGDVVYLSSLINVTQSFLELDKMAVDSAKDAIEDSATDALKTWIPRITKCMSKLEAMQRIWAKLQMRGIISSRANFSFDLDPDTVESIEASDFITTAVNMLRMSNDIHELRQQKQEAFINAYKSVSVAVLEKVASKFAADFQLFGFNDRPADIFDRAVP